MKPIVHFRRTPLYRGSPWNYRTQYEIVNWCIFILWILRIGSPAAWTLSAFQVKGQDGRYHSAPGPTEIYVVFTQAIVAIILFSVPQYVLSSYFIQIPVYILIIEICQYHAYLMIFRPAIDSRYVQYNFSRTIILTIFSYQGLISLFAIVYAGRFADQFSIAELNGISAWSLSAGILAGTGYSGITPKAGTVAALVGGVESIVGILFLTTILGIALSRASAKAITTTVWQGQHLVDPHEIRNALFKNGTGEAIERLQERLQIDLWVTGGWLRSYALGREAYEGDVDLLVADLSHEKLAELLVEKNIRFKRGRLGGFQFSPAPRVTIDCFSTLSFGPAVSVQESFGFFNATVNAAAFKFSSPGTFFCHSLFEPDATKRLLRILPDGLWRQQEQERGRSLIATLLLLNRENLTLVPDSTTRELVGSIANDERSVQQCNFICNMLDQAGRHHEAEIIRRWLSRP